MIMDSYRDRCRSIFNMLDGKVRIYLDTKYWLILRDVQLGKVTCSQKVGIYKKIIELKESNKAVFPISQYVLNEFVKQKDKQTLKESLELMSLLSNNTAIKTYEERVVEELILFLNSVVGGASHDEFKINHEFMWTSLPYAFGRFVAKSVDDDYFDEEVQKVLFSGGLVDEIFLKQLLESSADLACFEDISGVLEGKRNNKASSDTIVNQTKEFYLGLDNDLIKKSFMLLTGRFEQKNVNAVRNVLNNLKYQNKIHNVLPSLNTYSTLLTTWLIEQNSKIKINHFFDIHHASAAIPYFDVFLTEKSLKDGIQRVTPKYLSFNKCIVGAKLEDALKILSSPMDKF